MELKTLQREKELERVMFELRKFKRELTNSSTMTHKLNYLVQYYPILLDLDSSTDILFDHIINTMYPIIDKALIEYQNKFKEL